MDAKGFNFSSIFYFWVLTITNLDLGILHAVRMSSFINAILYLLLSLLIFVNVDYSVSRGLP